jgi:chromosome segregation ATPase
MSEEEIITINEIKDLIPIINNNIISFKKIVHKLERNYKNNRQNIDQLINDNIKINIKHENINFLINNINTELENNKQNIKDIKNNINNNNLEYISLKDKLNKNSLSIDYKFMLFTLFNVTISSIIYFLK